VEKWRLLVHGSFDAPTNMAIDEVLLNGASPVFRLYSWQPACFSLGRFQSPEKVLKENVPFVRRMTGGGRSDFGESRCILRVFCRRRSFGKT